MPTRAQFIAAYRRQLTFNPVFTPAAREHQIRELQRQFTADRPIVILGPMADAAWRALGKRGRCTYAALRSLQA